MKIIFSLFISLSVSLFSIAQTITDGSATLDMTQDIITGTGCGSNANFNAGNGVDQLFGMDWYIGIGTMSSQNFPEADSYTDEGNTITAQYTDLLGVSGLDAELKIILTELAPLDVQIAQIMQITNNMGGPLNIRLFNYVDLDKNNTQSDNGVLFLEDDCNFTTQISDAEDPSQVCYYTINASDGYEIASFPNLCKNLLGGIANLSNTGLPLSASDHTQALQYNATIPSGGQTTAEALLTFNNPPEAATTDASGQCTFGVGTGGDNTGGDDCGNLIVNDIALEDGSTSTSICVDGNPDPLDVVTDGGTGTDSGWIITDDNNNILAIPPAPPFDLDGAGAGTCLIWYVRYDDIAGNEVGNNLSDISGCFTISNSIEVIREAANGGTVALADGSTVATIIVDGVPDPLEVVGTTIAPNLTYDYVITDDNDMILAILPDSPIDLDGAGVGVCRIWGWSYRGLDQDAFIGSPIADLQAADCSDVSGNFIEVNRVESVDPQFNCTNNPIVINHNVVCNEGNGTYDVQFSISGGGAGSQGGVYNVAGDYTGTVLAGQVRSITDLAEGTIYSINVINDGFNCSASISNGPNNCSKLPIELLSFNGAVQSEGNLLKWVTASETENDYFSLYSSVNGEDYELINQQEGGGTTSAPQQYQFLNRNALQGIIYYQLQQTDFDGTTKIVAYTSVIRGEQLDVVLLDSFPNPFSHELSLNIYSNSNYDVILSLTDMLGSNIIQLQLNLVNGDNTILLETDHLSSGLYLLNIQNKNENQVYKLLKD